MFYNYHFNKVDDLSNAAADYLISYIISEYFTVIILSKNFNK